VEKEKVKRKRCPEKEKVSEKVSGTVDEPN